MLNTKFTGKFNNRNIKYGTVSVVITVMVIVFIVMLNAVLTFLFNRFPLSIDITRDRVFEITGLTRDFLAALDQDVTIYVMNTEANFVSTPPHEYFVQANEVMRRFSQHSRRVRLEHIDLLRNPGFAARFPMDQIEVNDVIVVSEGRHHVIFPTGLFNIRSTPQGNFIASSRAEQAITSAMMNVVNDERLLVTVITGHAGQEQELWTFLELLRLNNFETVEVNLFTGDVPPETSLLILAAPSRDLSGEELRRIDAFLAGGDNRIFFYLASVVQPPLPNLDAFLREWGIVVDSGLVFETDNRRLVSPSPFLAIVDYAEDVFSRNVLRRNLPMLIAHSRPLDMVFDEFRHRTVTPLLRFSPSSGVRPFDAPADWVPGPPDLAGNVPTLLLSSESRIDDDRNLLRSHVLVAGSVLAVEGTALGNPHIANAAYFLDLLGELTGREEGVFIMDKIIAFTELRASFAQVIVIAVIFTLLVPLAVLAAGIVVWLRRRHK